MESYKLVMFCQRCKKEHDRTHSPMFETGVQCDCGGYIVTPSGRANIQIKIEANVYLMHGKEFMAWIGAATEEEAVSHFQKTVEDNAVQIVKLKPNEINETKFCFDPNNTGDPEQFIWLTAREILVSSQELPVFMFGTDLKTYEEAKRRREQSGGES
jgi:hypothetical protein